MFIPPPPPSHLTPGTYRRNNAGPDLFCVQCKMGWYQVKEGQLNCTICPENHFCPVSHGVLTIFIHIVSSNYCGFTVNSSATTLENNSWPLAIFHPIFCDCLPNENLETAVVQCSIKVLHCYP